MGTPDFAVPALQALLHSSHNVIAVYTQPPRPKGRGQQVQLSPVHQLAADNGVPVFTPRSLRKDEQARQQFCLMPADVAVVAAYGLLLPGDVLEAPRLGCLNIHGSLLPRWRGASPIQHAVWKGDTESGNCIMKMEEGLDTGPVLLRRSVPIHAHTTASSLYGELSALGGVMIHEVIDYISVHGRLPPAETQDDRLATYAPLLRKEDGLIDWAQPAKAIDCQTRGLHPWPGVYTFTSDGKRLKVLEVVPVNMTSDLPPGTLIDKAGHIACGQGSVLLLKKVQPDNAKPMDMAAAFNGRYVGVGSQCGVLLH
ncbi:MAG: methionyl-tRNA formyltransferase [Micavibrio aeruginosavorus]|uniref:Methionyl-tRNA formyltransferase n=1 Tax=Micavibrio aeruginosavorus TaxID=349221 RepID=A0A7T5R2Q3_9BACT|nr:MAG: methionyl-tRNA formyltransferase [Micavibrio aeruginosavorus]